MTVWVFTQNFCDIRIPGLKSEKVFNVFTLLMFRYLIAEMLADIPEPEKFISETLASLPKWNPTSNVEAFFKDRNVVTVPSNILDNKAYGIVLKFAC